MAGILVVATVLRLAVVLGYDEVEPFGDQLAYLGGAEELARGETYSGSRGPGYSAFLAGVWALFGGSREELLSARLANVALGLLLLVLVRDAGRRLVGDRTGLLAAGVLAVHPNYVTFPLYVLSENLYTPLLAAALTLAVRSLGSRLLWAVLAGVLIGLGALTREMLVWFVPAAAVGLAIAGRRDLRDAAVRGAALLVCAALVVAPWTARNRIVHDRFVLVGFADGIPLFEGNWVETGEERVGASRWRRQPEKQAKWDYFHEFKRGGANSKLERNELYRETAWEFIRQRQPTWFLEKVVANGPRMIEPSMQTPFLWSDPASAGHAGVLRTVLVGAYLPLHALLLLLLPFGLARWRLFGPALLPLGYVSFAFLVHIVANAGPMRFQLPHEWILVLGATSAITRPAPLRRHACVVLCGLVLAALVITAGSWNNLGRALFLGERTAHERWQEDQLPGDADPAPRRDGRR